jgi:hypothetical protein
LERPAPFSAARRGDVSHFARQRNRQRFGLEGASQSQIRAIPETSPKPLICKQWCTRLRKLDISGLAGTILLEPTQRV